MTKKILIVGANDEETALISTMREKYSNDIVLITADKARNHGIKTEEFDESITIKLRAPEPYVMSQNSYCFIKDSSVNPYERNPKFKSKKLNKKGKR